MELDPSAQLTYYAEGGANVLYRIMKGDLRVEGYLLRLRKAVPNATPICPAEQDLTDKYVTRRFSEGDVVEQKLIKIPRATVFLLNVDLAARDGDRSEDRRGSYLAVTEYGQLITDMSSQHGQSNVTIEVKPKWLLQSPNAPPESKRCRTCALRAAVGKKSDNICPLNLLSHNEDRRRKAVQVILRKNKTHKHSDIPHQAIEDRLTAYFWTSPLLRKLRDLQQELDPDGILYPAPRRDDEKMLGAMTLRDCSLYVKVCILKASFPPHPPPFLRRLCRSADQAYLDPICK